MFPLLFIVCLLAMASTLWVFMKHEWLSEINHWIMWQLLGFIGFLAWLDSVAGFILAIQQSEHGWAALFAVTATSALVEGWGGFYLASTVHNKPAQSKPASK